MKEIADFFALPEAEQTYEMAVSLYARFGSNRMLGSHFAMRQNKYNMEKVRYELCRITGITGAQLVKEEKQKKQAPPPPSTTTDDSSAQHQAKYEAAIARIAYLTNQKGIRANTLIGFADGDDDGRKRVMDEIGEMDDEIADINRRITVYAKSGQMPDAATAAQPFMWEVAKKPLELVRQQTNLRSQISKATKAGDDAKLKTLNERLNLVNAELEKVRGEFADTKEQG